MAHISFSVIRFLIYHGPTMIWSNPSVRSVSMNAEPRGEKVPFLGWLCMGQCACRRHWLLACTSSLLSSSPASTFKSGGSYAPKSRFVRRVAASNRAFAETRPPISPILRPNSSRIVYGPSFFPVHTTREQYREIAAPVLVYDCRKPGQRLCHP